MTMFPFIFSTHCHYYKMPLLDFMNTFGQPQRRSWYRTFTVNYQIGWFDTSAVCIRHFRRCMKYKWNGMVLDGTRKKRKKVSYFFHCCSIVCSVSFLSLCNVSFQELLVIFHTKRSLYAEKIYHRCKNTYFS